MGTYRSFAEFADKIAARAAKERANGSRWTVIVGFTAAYAVYVHENLEAHHPVGMAKFLESAARELRHELVRVAVETYRQTGSLLQGLLLAGLRLQREAQRRTPVDTGALRASAVTRQI